MKTILNYQVEQVTDSQYWDTYYSEFMQDYPDEMTFIREGILTEEEKDKRKSLTYKCENISHHFILKDGDKAIALFRGEQKDIDIYYLRHGVVKKEYRRQGIFSEFVNQLIEYCKDLGFVQIICCFVSSNNYILSQMIKKDFYLTAIEIHAEYGQIGWLSRYLNEDLKKAYLYRTGMVCFSDKLFHNSEGNMQKFLDLLEKRRECTDFPDIPFNYVKNFK